MTAMSQREEGVTVVVGGQMTGFSGEAATVIKQLQAEIAKLKAIDTLKRHLEMLKEDEDNG